jgi:hypothetical protein
LRSAKAAIEVLPGFSVVVLTVMPGGRASIAEHSFETMPFTSTIACTPAKRNGSTSLRASVAALARANGIAAMGATLVWRHSSSRVVGNPLSRKRRNAHSRDWCDAVNAGSFRNVSNAATSASCRSATAATLARRLLDPAVALGFQLEREFLAA